MTKADKRLTLLRNRMENEQVDLVALGPGPHMQWLPGFHPHADERPCLICVGEGATLNAVSKGSFGDYPSL